MSVPVSEGGKSKFGSGNYITEEFLEDNRETVKKLSQLGCTYKEIGDFLEVSSKSIERHFKQEVEWGRSNLRQSLRKAQIECAIREKNSTMLIWLGKNYLEQREPRQNIEHSGSIKIEKVMFGSNDKDNKNS